MTRGECNCGSVGFEISIRLPGIFVCHCSICRRSTGTNGIAVLVVPNQDFHWLRGEAQIATWKKPGHDWEKRFCRVCGSPLPGANDDATTFIPAGLIFENDARLKVIHHIWVDSKASWDEISDAGKQHRGAFGG